MRGQRKRDFDHYLSMKVSEANSHIRALPKGYGSADSLLENILDSEFITEDQYRCFLIIIGILKEVDNSLKYRNFSHELPDSVVELVCFCFCLRMIFDRLGNDFEEHFYAIFQADMFYEESLRLSEFKDLEKDIKSRGIYSYTEEVLHNLSENSPSEY